LTFSHIRLLRCSFVGRRLTHAEVLPTSSLSIATRSNASAIVLIR
jgi:hypothetical protein